QGDVVSLRGGALIGRSAFICGDPYSAADVFEKAVAQRPTVEARFNLATAYARTARYQAAADLYRTVVANGQFTVLTLDTEQGVSGSRPASFNAADEAAVRLADMGARIAADQSTAAIGDTGEDATNPIQAIIDRAHVPSDRALFFDGLTTDPELTAVPSPVTHSRWRQCTGVGRIGIV
ncbi:MAG TPA: hypothetical protein VF633_10955, partial [Brevundimonas sp.]